MSAPLRNNYDWQQPLLMSALPAVIMALWAVFTRTPEAWVITTSFVVLWLLYGITVWLRTRAWLELDDDDVLHVRRWFRTRTVAPGEVVRVKEIVNGRSPDVLLITRDKRRVRVPSSYLQGGHSVLFAWLLQYSPDVEMDKGCQRIVDKLTEQGKL